MAYILSSPDLNTNPEITLSVPTISGNLVITALQDVTINNAVDVFSWQQLDTVGKFQVPTTSTNSLTTTLVVDTATFFGNTAATSGSADKLGLLGLSTTKTLANVSINMGASKTVTGQGYVTGLSPTVSADNPVWTTPVTISITGDLTFA